MANKTNALADLNADNPTFQTGRVLKTIQYRSSDITAANSANGDLFPLAGPLGFDDRIARIQVRGTATPALTSATDNDLGFWFRNASGTFVELDKDILWDGITLATGVSHPDLLTGFNANLDMSKTIGQLLNLGTDREPFGGVYLVLQTNTAQTATGPLRLSLAIEVDCATGR